MGVGVLRAPALHRRHSRHHVRSATVSYHTSHNRNFTEYFFPHWTFLRIPGWSKTKICSYSFYDIHQCPLSLGKRLEEHPGMQCAVSHTNSSWIILQELQFWSPRKSPWITGILIKNKINTFPVANSTSTCWVCAPNRAGKGGCSPQWILARWRRLPELHISEPSTAIPSSQSKPHVPKFQQGAPRSRAFPLHQHHHTDNLPTQTVAQTIIFCGKSEKAVPKFDTASHTKGNFK